MHPDDGALLDAARAAGLAIEFLGDADLADLDEDLKTQSAVLHQLLVLGEAVKRVSTGFREAHPEIPWRQITGMRDVLIHAYDEVDLVAVHKTVHRDLPTFLAQLSALLPQPPSGP